MDHIRPEPQRQCSRQTAHRGPILVELPRPIDLTVRSAIEATVRAILDLGCVRHHQHRPRARPLVDLAIQLIRGEAA